MSDLEHFDFGDLAPVLEDDVFTLDADNEYHARASKDASKHVGRLVTRLARGKSASGKKSQPRAGGPQTPPNHKTAFDLTGWLRDVQ